MKDIFISHSSLDKDNIVNELVISLEHAGLEVWLDSQEILCGDNILEKIKEGIENTYCVALILTEHFFNSFWTPLEIGLGMASETKSIIPILVDLPDDIIKNKAPWILSHKYLKTEKKALHTFSIHLSNEVSKIKIRVLHTSPNIVYKEAVRKFNNLDIPAANKISLLINEYDQISKINILTSFSQASQIAMSVIDDLWARHEKLLSKQNDKSYSEKLNILSSINSGLNNNVKEHLGLLVSSSLEDNYKSFSNDSNRKLMTDLSLASVTDWFAHYLSSYNSPAIEMLEIAWPGSLKRNDFEDMYEIDKMVLRDDLIAPPEITYNWYKYNNYTHIAIRSSKSKKVIGYFTLLPVTDELYQQILSGDFKDNDLSVENIRQYDIPDFYKLYIACVCIHKEYQNTTAFSKLYNALIQMMYELATDREIYITDIITEASTGQGLKLCKIVGLHKMLDTNLDTAIYGATLLPPALRLRNNFGNKLIKFYQDKYLEFEVLF